MFTRLITLMFIITLAIPVTTLTGPGDTHQAPWSDVAVAAKGKRHNKNDKKKTRTVTRAVRQLVTQTFTGAGPISLPVGSPGALEGPGSPYPAAIVVSGFARGTITDVNLILTDFTNSYVSDVDILLSHDDGRRALLMSDVAEATNVTGVDLTLDDEAATRLSPTGLTSGTFQPANLQVGPDPFPAPAPQPDGSIALSTFDGADPNGTWQLWVNDTAPSTNGEIGGWALQITAEVDVHIQEQVKDKKRNKKGKKRR